MRKTWYFAPKNVCFSPCSAVSGQTLSLGGVQLEFRWCTGSGGPFFNSYSIRRPYEPMRDLYSFVETSILGKTTFTLYMHNFDLPCTKNIFLICDVTMYDSISFPCLCTDGYRDGIAVTFNDRAPLPARAPEITSITPKSNITSCPYVTHTAIVPGIAEKQLPQIGTPTSIRWTRPATPGYLHG